MGVGEAAWSAKLDLSGLPELRDELLCFDVRTKYLAETAARLENERVVFSSRRQSAAARFDEQRNAVLREKQPVEVALTAARQRLVEKNTAMQTLQALSASLTAEQTTLENELVALGPNPTPDKSARIVARQSRKQQIQSELGQAAQESHAIQSVLPQVSGEVSKLFAVNQEFEQRLKKLDAERVATLSPLDSNLQRIERASIAAKQESASNVQSRGVTLKQLGLKLYERRNSDPALAEGLRQVATLDRYGAVTQSEVEASLAESAAIPRGTMLKFWSTLALTPVLLFACVSGSYFGWEWWETRHEGDASAARVQINPYLVHPLSQNAAYVLADRFIAANNEQDVRNLLLDAFRAIHLGVYTANGKKILGGAERSDKDFYVYDFIWKTLAHGFTGRSATNWENFSQVLGGDLLHLRNPSSFRLVFLQSVQARYEKAQAAPTDPKSFLILLVDGLARRQLKPYTLSELTTRPPKDLYSDRVQSFLLMLDFFTQPPKTVPPRSQMFPIFPDLVERVYADEGAGCDSVQGEGEEGEWGEGLSFLIEKIENMAEAVGGEGATKAVEEIAESIGLVAGQLSSSMDIDSAIDALTLLSGVTVTVHASPEMIHLPHGGETENQQVFSAQVTIDLEDAPAAPIPCGPLKGPSKVPSGRKALKGVSVEWDWNHDFELYYKLTDDTVDKMTGRYATFTDEDGQTEIKWISRRYCQGQGMVVGPDYLMQATATNIIGPPLEAVLGGSNLITQLLKVGPSIYQFVAPETRGYANHYVRWHEKKPKKQQRV